MSDEESDSEEPTYSTSDSSSSSEDNDELIEEDPMEKDFLKTLSCLKNKDPQIYDKNVQFFPLEDKQPVAVERSHSKKEVEKPMYLKDYERDVLANNWSVIDDDSAVEPPRMTYNQEQKALKESFKKVVNEDSSDDEDNSVLLKRKEKGEKEKEEEEKDYIQWLKGKKEQLDDKAVESELKPLHDYWNNPKLDEREQFLKDYILNKRYLGGSQGNYNGSDLSEDEELLEMQEDFEHRYNSRFDDDDNKTLKRYPRNVEGSLRRKNDARKRKREEIKERKLVEKEKKKLEIKKKQKKKLEEVKEKLSKIKEITGNEELGFNYDEIMEDFDPEKHDQKMQQVYNEQFYSARNEEKPEFSDCEGDEDWNIEDINMDCEAEPTGTEQSKAETRSKKKRKKRKAAFTDICDVVKPVFDPEKHRSYQKYIDEFYNLDCEDFIDDIPCRFKYRDTVPNDYGLSVEEILKADDKELNRWVSAKKICKLRPNHVEKNEVKIYQQKSKDDQLKKKLLPSLFNAEDEPETAEDLKEDIIKDDEEQSKTETDQADKETPKKKRKSKKGASAVAPMVVEEQNNADEPLAKKKKKFNRDASKGNKPLNGISDNRLLAYNIKPKQFKAKLKHSKHKK